MCVCAREGEVCVCMCVCVCVWSHTESLSTCQGLNVKAVMDCLKNYFPLTFVKKITAKHITCVAAAVDVVKRPPIFLIQFFLII